MIESERKAIVLFTRRGHADEAEFQEQFLNFTRVFFDDVRMGRLNQHEYFFGRQLSFFILDFNNNQVKRLGQFLGVQEKDLPYILTMKFDKETKSLIKYEYIFSLTRFAWYDYQRYIQLLRWKIHPFNRVRDLKTIKDKNTNVHNLGYSIMKNLLITSETDLSAILKEELREHQIVSYTVSFCNYCLRIQPLVDKVSLRFSKAQDGIVFNRYDLDKNDFDFIDFDAVPLIMFYPKGVHDNGVEIVVLDEDYEVLTVDVVEKQIRKLMQDYEDIKRKNLKRVEMSAEDAEAKTDL